MNYKQFSACALALALALQAGAASATVREDTETAAVPQKSPTIAKVKMQQTAGLVVKNTAKAKAQKQTAVTRKSKAGAITADKNAPVVSNKPALKNDAQAITTEKKQQPAPSLLQEREGKFYFAGTLLPDDYRSIGIFGASIAKKSQAIAYIKLANPSVQLACTVEELVDLYWQEAEREQVRPDLALAQSLVETGAYRYGGDVLHHQNNFCGLGTIGGGVRGASFSSPQLGVRAHIQHLLAYTQTKRPSTEIVDPRYDLAHNIRLERGVVDTWYGLNGTWAMGSLYCEKIMATYQKILAQPVSETVVEEPPKKKKQSKKSMKEKVKEILAKEKMGRK